MYKSYMSSRVNSAAPKKLKTPTPSFKQALDLGFVSRPQCPR